MLLVGEPVSANKALLWGLVNDVVPYNQLDGAVDALCNKLIDRFPRSTRYTRQQLSFWKDMAWDATIRQAREYLSLHLAGVEAAEGMKALAERVEMDYRAFRRRVAGEATGPELKAVRDCAACGARGLPQHFKFCGVCGASLKAEE
jgi:1,4-dihydroxy-2-naphthoyl-CoA synthase